MASILNATTSSGLVTSADNSGSLQLATNNGNTAVTIDTSQNVGIGTTSPSHILDVSNTSATNKTFRIGQSSGGATANSTVIISNGGTGDAMLRFDYEGSNTDRARIGVTASNQALQFYTAGNNERMRIDSSGNLLVGATATSGNAKFFVDGSVTDNISRMFNSSATPYGLYIRYSGAAPNNTGQEFLFLNDTGATRFTARSNGGLANYSANNVNLSDAREKTNVELAGSYLDKICAIPVKTFNYIDQNREDDDGLTLGVVAQDVQAVAPELVSESDWSIEKDGSKMRLSIYQTDLQYALMKSIQELKAELDATKAEVQALKGVA